MRRPNGGRLGHWSFVTAVVCIPVQGAPASGLQPGLSSPDSSRSPTLNHIQGRGLERLYTPGHKTAMRSLNYTGHARQSKCFLTPPVWAGHTLASGAFTRHMPNVSRTLAPLCVR